MRYFIALVMFMPSLLFARLGGSTAAFLSIGGGARAIALGGAYSAFAEGVDAIYWNPAGVAKFTNIGANFVHSNLFGGVLTTENLGIIIPVKGGGLGISVIALLSGRIEITTPQFPHGTGTYYSANNFAVGLSYGRRMTDKFNLGLTIKGINQNIHRVQANGVAFDIGGVYNIKIKELRFGFIIQNFGPDIAYAGEGLSYETGKDTLQKEDIPATYKAQPDPLPLNFQMGLAMDILSTPIYKLSIMGDLVHPSDQETTFGFGVEYCMLNMLFARLGYTGKNSRGQIIEIIGKKYRFFDTFGIGANILQKGRKIIIDYAYELHLYLPGIHRFGIGFEI